MVARILKGVLLTYSAYNPFNINADLILGGLGSISFFFTLDKINLNPTCSGEIPNTNSGEFPETNSK